MKCDDCLNMLEQYLDGEATPRDAEHVSAHLMACVDCNQEWEMLTAEGELYARYDREVEVSSSMWTAIAARTVESGAVQDAHSPVSIRGWWTGLFSTRGLGLAFAGAMAILLVALSGSALYLRSHRPAPNQQLTSHNNVHLTASPTATALSPSSPTPVDDHSARTEHGSQLVSGNSKAPVIQKVAPQQSDVLFKEDADSDIEDRDTASHLEQAQNLLRSVRNIQLSDTDEEIDVSYEKAQSRRLLNENVVLRRDAEMAGKFPAKSVLGSLEPFLIDIANLPDKASPSELRQLKERVQKTEIVAVLQSY